METDGNNESNTTLSTAGAAHNKKEHVISSAERVDWEALKGKGDLHPLILPQASHFAMDLLVPVPAL